MTINNKNYSSPRNINLKEGILRFGGTQASNPIASTDYGIYIDDSGNLKFSSAGTTTILGAAGSGGGAAPSWDAIFQGDQALQLGALGSFTVDRSSGDNDVITVTNSGGGAGDCIQITNAGTGSDIEGTSGLWKISNVGDIIGNIITLAGDDGTDSITLTTGDIAVVDGSLTIVDADNAATLSITNDTATSESVIVFAGSGTYTGDTTKAFMTITPSGLTSGEAVYLPLAAITTGKGLYVLSGTTLTSGALVTIESGAGTAITNTTGALLEVKSGDTAGTNAVLVGMSTAATDETVLLKLTASDVLALGNIINISASAMTTGSGIVMSNLDALTTGRGIYVASASTVIATTGRLFLSSHSGATSTSGILNEFITTATDETILLQLTNATAGQVDGTLLKVSSTGYTTGHTGDVVYFVGSGTTGGGSVLQVTSANTTAGQGATITSGVTTTNGSGLKLLCEALTTGVGLRFAHTTSVIADGGSMVRLSDSGVATGGATNGTILDIVNTGSVAGTLVKITSNLAAQTATCLLDVVAAGYTTGYTGSVVKMTGVSTTGSGTVLSVTSANTTAGGAVLITSGATTTNGYALKVLAEGLTTGTGILFAHTTSVIADGGSMLRLSDSGVATGGATNGTILDIQSTGSTAGTLVKIKSNVAGQTATCLLDVVAAGYTAGYTGNVVSITGCGTTGASNVLSVAGVNTTAGNIVSITNASNAQTGASLLSVVQSATTTGYTGSVVAITASSTTGSGCALLVTGANTTAGNVVKIVADTITTGGSGLLISGNGLIAGTSALVSLTHTTSVLGAGNSMFRISSTGADTGTTTGTLIDLAQTAAVGNIGVLLTDSGANAAARSLIKVNVTNASAVGAIPIEVQNAAVTGSNSKFKKIGKFGSVTLYVGIDAGGNTGEGQLTGVAGDILFNGGSNQVEYCDADGTNWTTLV